MRSYIMHGPLVPHRPGGYSSPVIKSAISGTEFRHVQYATWRRRPKGLAILRNLTSHYASTSETIKGRGSENSITGVHIAVNYSAQTTVIPPLEIQRASSRAIMGLRERIKGETINLSVMAAEAGKTFEFFVDTGRQVIKLYNAVKRGDMKTLTKAYKTAKRRAAKEPWGYLLKRPSKELSRKWLMWRYALCPLMYDLDGVLKELHRSGINPMYTRMTAKSNVSYGRSDAISSSFGEATIRAGCYFEAKPQSQAWARLGLINPLQTLWELTPLSFVVDWFLPIGDFLGSLDSLVGVNLVSTWQTHKEECSGTRFATAYPLGETQLNSQGQQFWNPNAGRYTTDRASFKSSTYSRQTPVSLDIPRLNYTPGLNGKRFFDSLALMRTSMRR